MRRKLTTFENLVYRPSVAVLLPVSLLFCLLFLVILIVLSPLAALMPLRVDDTNGQLYFKEKDGD